MNWLAFRPAIKVFLDGVEQREAIEADDAAGYVIVHKRDAAGKLVINQAARAVERVTLFGDVRIELPPRAAPRVEAKKPLAKTPQPGRRGQPTTYAYRYWRRGFRSMGLTLDRLAMRQGIQFAISGRRMPEPIITLRPGRLLVLLRRREITAQ